MGWRKMNEPQKKTIPISSEEWVEDDNPAMIDTVEPKEEFVAEMVEVSVTIAQNTFRHGKMRKRLGIEFEKVGMFASDLPGDQNAWGDQIERVVAQAEETARLKAREHEGRG